MSPAVSPVAIVFTAVLGCILCGIGAFALFAAAMSLAWPIAALFAVLAAAIALAVGYVLGRRSRRNGIAGAAALAAPSLALGLYFLGDLLIALLSTPEEPGIPVAALVFLAFAVLLGVPAVIGARLAAPAGR